MARLFKRPENEKNKSSKDSSAILIPQNLAETKLLRAIGNGPELLFIKSLETILKLGDFDDFKYISEEIARNLFEEILNHEPFLAREKETNEKENSDLESLTRYLNKLLLTYRLGYVQLHISTDDSKKMGFEIYLYDSMTVLFGKKVKLEEETVCSFYEMLFQLLFSKIFNDNVEVREKFCSISSEDNRCIFDMKFN